MIATESPCLPIEVLRDVAEGRLPVHRFEHFASHIDACSHCAKKIEELSSAALPIDSDLNLLRLSNSHLRDDAENEIECQMGVQQMIARQPESAARQPTLHQMGPYRLAQSLGQGGMGAVFLAEHSRLKRSVAIKLLPREKNAQLLDRFNREMQAVAAMEHPNIVRALDAGEHDQWNFLVMEFLDGLDLSKLLSVDCERPVGAICEIGRQAALGLAAIHDAGMIHRDIKPSNLFVTRGGVTKVLDLGLVYEESKGSIQDERLTTLGNLMGTLGYMSPEQLNDSRDVDNRSDLYSLGATLYQLLTGQSPHGSTRNLGETVRRISQGDVIPIADLRPDIPDQVAGLVMQMLSKNSVERPDGAGVVAECLAAFADHDALLSLARSAIPLSQSVTANHSISPKPSTDSEARVETSAIENEKGGPPNRWTRWWIAAALLPLSFLGGIVLTIATDRGELTIRSEIDDVRIAIRKGTQIVDELVVSQNDASVKLQSGTYEIQLQGTNTDGLQVSQNQVALTRGSKVVVDIQRVPISPDELPGDSNTAAADFPDNSQDWRSANQQTEPLYQGKPFSYWKDIVYTERDVKTLCDAMKAVTSLSQPDNLDAVAVACLVPLRRHGAFVIGERPGDPIYDQLSIGFANLPWRTRVHAISQELNEGFLPSFGSGTRFRQSVWAAFKSLIAARGTDRNRNRPSIDAPIRRRNCGLD